MFILLVILNGYSLSLHTILMSGVQQCFFDIFVEPFMHIFAELNFDNQTL